MKISLAQIKQGEKTKTIYTWIKDGNYKDAITILNDELCLNPNSRAALSLLSYCYYSDQDFFQALQCYEQLIELFPDQPNYLLNYAKCLFQAGNAEKALKIAHQFNEKFANHFDPLKNDDGADGERDSHNNDAFVNKSRESVPRENHNPTEPSRSSSSKKFMRKFDHDFNEFARIELLKLQAAIKYTSDDDDYINARLLINQIPDGNVDKEANLGCLLFKEKRYEEAIETFQNCMQIENLNYSSATKSISSSTSSASASTTTTVMTASGTRTKMAASASSLSSSAGSSGTQNFRIQSSSNLSDRINSSNVGGYETILINQKPDLLYNLAVCYYHLKHYPEAMKFIGEIIEQGIREHPELSVGMNTEGLEVRSVGNTEILNQSVLVEAFNLKAAIEYQLKNIDAAQEALTDMPPRSEEELDAVTLHNMALVSMDQNPSEGFEKLQFLIGQDSFHPETFANLLLLYCRFEYFELAADLMAENASFTYRYLTPNLYEFLDALITQQTSPEDAYQKFDEIGTRYLDSLRKLNKQRQETEARIQKLDDKKEILKQNELLKKLSYSFDEILELYVPVLMAQAKIYWDLECYVQIEKIFRKSAEFCNELDLWKLNVAHILFMQENKFKEATGFYEQLVKKHYDNILNVSAIVLANLCVSYIMTGQNEDAEELMRKIEKEEEQLIYGDPDRKVFHLCTVNLVIGTLYCSKGNYEFGISRVIKSLDPYPKKLGTDTWFYAKRCFLSMLENLAKQIIVIKDSVLRECLTFLTMCEQYGRNIKAIVEAPLELETLHPGRNTVTYEARLLKAILLEIIEN
ncbi:Tetratricopeptide repeat protein 30A [Sarcoptes scabiei]|uniref:Tetratricopeptide repeat protein 30 n=1 Tax=Sarcoptes scabiei TaxID=52283 RepID=A0A834R9J1_SARSC|nr:Tetratricopeptide repeat protein 30A [Sarcoptes scabiei]